MAESDLDKDEIEIVEEEEQQETQELAADSDGSSEEGSEKEQELEQYSKSVQNRISKLTQRYREEESQRKAAIEFAEAVKKLERKG